MSVFLHACVFAEAFCGGCFPILPITAFFCNVNIKNEYLSAVQGCVLWDRESGEWAVCVDERRTRGIDF